MEKVSGLGEAALKKILKVVRDVIAVFFGLVANNQFGDKTCYK